VTESIRTSRSTALALVTSATFVDIVAYSVAVPVLPDLSQRLGASPTRIGLLFASFGVTLLVVSMPMGAVSDRIGRKPPLVGGLIALAAATLLFAFADSLPWLFAARLVQGAADAITWVVGFALVADLYDVTERGRVTGIVMAGTSLAIIVGPSLGGWLYEVGGIRLPFLAVAALTAVVAAGFMWIEPPHRRAARDAVPVSAVLRTPTIAACGVAVVAASSTISMLEPVLSLHLRTFGIGPGRVGLVFGVGAVASTTLHPIIGRLADRWGSRKLTLCGLVASAIALPILGQTGSFSSATASFVLSAAASALIITPSLAYMGEATTEAGLGSFGVAYGIYNMAWGAGLLAGPALGGFAYERIGFSRLTLAWAPGLLLVTMALATVRSPRGARAA
jgi:MFS transporter, DHA1 family, solute carrier family 18 (vesicular amine transporter), member 1/2